MSETDAAPAFYSEYSLQPEIYDALACTTLAHSAAGSDVDFFRRLAAQTGGPILEIGCGTGRVTMPLAGDGHEIVGIDRSAPMLAIAEAHRAALPADTAARISYREADLATLDLGREFALIVAPSRVFQFMLTTDAQRQALAALRRHLRPDGRLVLDLFDPLLEYVIPSSGGMRSGGEVIHPRTGNRVTWSVTGRWPDPGRQLIVEDWTFTELGPAGETLRSDTERLTLRWSLRAEMRLLFELEGFAVIADYGDFNEGPAHYGGEQVWVLAKA
jgi:SAM-dependent methyltransferase